MKNVAQNKDRNKECTRRVPALRFPAFAEPSAGRSEFARGSAGVSKGGSSRVRDAAAVGLEWEELKLGDLLTFKNGVNAAKEKYGRGHRFINVLDIIENDYLTHERIRGSVDISDADFEKNKVEYGDILFQRSSETREEVGQANVYLDEHVPATFGGFVIMGKKIGNYDPTFLNYLLRTSSVREDMTSRSGGSTRYNIGQDSLKKVPIVIPKEPEQKKIAGFLGAVDEWIGILREEKSVLETYKRGVMQRLFSPCHSHPASAGQASGGNLGSPCLRFHDDTGNNFPEWEEKKLGDILKVKKGEQLGRMSMDEGGQYPVINGGITESGYSNKWNTPADTITVSEGGNSCGFVSKIMTPFWCGGHCYALSDISKEMDADFLFHRLKYSQEDIMRLRVGSGLPNIQKKDIENFLVGLPCPEEQNKIAYFLTALDEIITAKDDEITNAEEWKKGLMQKMFV